MALTLSALQGLVVRSWTIREIGNFKKIPTATLRAKMQQRGVLFGVDEQFSQNKVDGTVALLTQLYKDTGVAVLVTATRLPAAKNGVKVEYAVRLK